MRYAYSVMWINRNSVLIIGACVLAIMSYLGCKRLNANLNRGLEEEKSFSRHAMEYHRLHPDKRAGDTVLDSWSRADYIAQTIKQNNKPGEWVETTDRIQILPQYLRKDEEGLPFCVLRRSDSVVVIRYIQRSFMDCTSKGTETINTSRITSGDMEFSGRSDYWIYVLR
jgi:hypothetical protein